MEIVIIVLSIAALYFTYEIVKYNTDLKRHEKDNKQRSVRIREPRKKSRSRTKTPKMETSDKSKSKRTYKKKKKSVKKKTND